MYHYTGQVTKKDTLKGLVKKVKKELPILFILFAGMMILATIAHFSELRERSQRDRTVLTGSLR